MDLVLSFGTPISKFQIFYPFLCPLYAKAFLLLFSCSPSFGLLKSYEMPCNVESASLEPKLGNTFIAGGEDMWVHRFDFQTGEEIGKFLQK